MTIRENKIVLEDTELVRRCRGGDEEALRELYERYSGSILNHLYRMCMDRTRAEDLTEETFFRVWQKAALFDGRKGSFKTWLFRMATRLAINGLKKRARRERLAPTMPLCDQEARDHGPAPHEHAQGAETRRLVTRALSTLGEKDRAVLVLRHIEGMDEGEVSKVLGIPRGTVKSRTYYALRRLRHALGGAGI